MDDKIIDFGSRVLGSRPIHFSEGASIKSNKLKRHDKYLWDDFLERIKEPVRTGETFKAFQAATGTERDDIKDVGYFIFGLFHRNVRKKTNLKTRDVITLDIDYANEDWAFDMPLIYGAWTYALYSTHSHSSASPRLRLVIPLTRAVTIDEYEPLARRMAGLYDIEFFDRTTFQFSRAMHFPSCASDGDYVFESNKNKWLDPDVVLNQYTDRTDPLEWPRAMGDTQALRKGLDHASNPRDKDGWVGAFCRAYTIQEAIDKYLPDVYERGMTDDRYSYKAGRSANGLVIYNDYGPGTFAYSHHSTDPARDKLHNSYDLVRIHLFGGEDTQPKKGEEEVPIQKRKSSRAMVERVMGDTDVVGEMMKAQAAEFPDVFDDLLEDEDSDLTPKDKAEWKKLLVPDSKGKPRNTLLNVVAILRRDAAWCRTLRYNDFSREIVLLRDVEYKTINSMYWGSGELFTERDAVQLKHYVAKNYGFEPRMNLIWEAVEIIATSRSFHPVCTYLNTLPRWDGVPRVDHMLHDYLGVEITPYTTAVSRKMLCGAINRVMHPGSKWDYMVILEGIQGKRKSMWIEALAHQWFTSDLRGISAMTSALENLRGKWIIEISELQGISNRREVDTIKAFITRSTDRMRVAYARASADYPRQCIFIGSTNQEHYLVDETGNRRFWPVTCTTKNIDLETFNKNVEQIWAEAMIHWQAGEQLYFDETVETLARAEQARREIDTGVEGVIDPWLDEPVDSDDFGGAVTFRNATCVQDIWENCYNGDITKMSEKWRHNISTAMRKVEGWTYSTRVTVGRYGRQRGITRDTPK